MVLEASIKDWKDNWDLLIDNSNVEKKDAIEVLFLQGGSNNLKVEFKYDSNENLPAFMTTTFEVSRAFITINIDKFKVTKEDNGEHEVEIVLKDDNEFSKTYKIYLKIEHNVSPSKPQGDDTQKKP